MMNCMTLPRPQPSGGMAVLFVLLLCIVPCRSDIDSSITELCNITVGKATIHAPHPSLYPEVYWVRVGKSFIHGRGVFAVRDLKINTIVEVCPTLTLSKEACVHQKCNLMDYMFQSEETDHMVMAMGYGMMYNSAINPNLLHYFDIDGNMVFVAKRDIVRGEELFHYYGEEWWYTRKGRPEPQLQPPSDVIEL